MPRYYSITVTILVYRFAEEPGRRPRLCAVCVNDRQESGE